MIDLSVGAGAATGLLLALARVAAFVVATPFLSKAVPMIGRLAFTMAVGFFLAEEIAPPETVFELIGLMLVNIAAGIVLGFLTGLLFHLFATAGALVDLSSGLAVATIYDPSSGEPNAVFGRLFNIVALTAYILVGGLQLLVAGLAFSVKAVPLDGQIGADADLMDVLVRLVGHMLVAAIELAFPVLAALFLAEIVLGLAGRFAPSANVLLLGLPAKILLTFTVLSVSFVLFPEAIDGVVGGVEDAFRQGVAALAPAEAR